MRLLILKPHRYYHRAEHQLYCFSPGESRELPEALGQLLLAAHPDKFAPADTEAEAEADTEINGGPQNAAMDAPPTDKVVRRARKPRQPRQAQRER